MTTCLLRMATLEHSERQSQPKVQAQMGNGSKKRKRKKGGGSRKVLLLPYILYVKAIVYVYCMQGRKGAEDERGAGRRAADTGGFRFVACAGSLTDHQFRAPAQI